MRRPLLAPGLHVLRRGDTRLQVGLVRDRAVVLPDTEPVRRDLRRLLGGEILTDAEVPAAVRPLLAASPSRTNAKVRVVGFGHPSGEPLRNRLRGLLTASGLSPGRTRYDIAVIAGVGEPSRDLVDPFVQASTPHVLVRLVEGHAVVGPFVAPGQTACLRCLDATATDDDPSWPLLVEQYASACSRDRRDGTTEPVDPALAELACAWAVRDAASYVQGHRPSTWSATVKLDPLLHDIVATAWLRHPACGCTWTMDP
jgi:bacteriocin biosynthesis cyclodehydratase domain-containing protein